MSHGLKSMELDSAASAQTWRTTRGDMTDEECELIGDLVAPYWSPCGMGRPVTVDRRRVVDVIVYVAATGCQWRALPATHPNWNTVHRYHLAWSRDGIWERIAAVSPLRSVRPTSGRSPAGARRKLITHGIADSVHRTWCPGRIFTPRWRDCQAPMKTPSARERGGRLQCLGGHRLPQSDRSQLRVGDSRMTPR